MAAEKEARRLQQLAEQEKARAAAEAQRAKTKRQRAKEKVVKKLNVRA